jgi:hypothetical protein
MVDQSQVLLPFVVIEWNGDGTLWPRDSNPVIVETPMDVAIKKSYWNSGPAEPTEEREIHPRPRWEMTRISHRGRHRRGLSIRKLEAAPASYLFAHARNCPRPLRTEAYHFLYFKTERAEGLKHLVRPHAAP